MDAAIISMNKTIINLPVYHDTHFRNPSRYEHAIGFWVDRIGSAQDSRRPVNALRILGQYVVVSVESGNGVLLTKSKGAQAIHPGDVFLLMPDEPAAYYPHRTWSTRWIVWNGAAACHQTDIFVHARRKLVFRQAATIVRQSFFELVKLMKIEDQAAVLERQAVVLNMLAGLLRADDSASFTGNASLGLDVVVQHIRRHLASRLTPDELAELCHLSAPHFRRMFRRYTGHSPLEFILAERIAGAKALLIRGASIKQAAQEMGFADRFYFMRLFKKIAGQTAGQFVATARGIRTTPRKKY